MNSVVEVIPYLTTDPQQAAVNLEVAMQALVLDERDPLALEITGEGSAKRFLLRACRPETVAHAEAQLRMRYPQAIFVPVPALDDPLLCHRGEAVSVIELAEGTAQYLPLQTWDEQTLRQPGINPLLGILGALRVSDRVRAVAQMALVPAPAAWSKRQQQYTRPNSDIDTALLTSITRTIRAESQKGETQLDATTANEEKKRGRTRKGKEETIPDATNGHGSLHSMELLAQQKNAQTEEEGTQQSTPDEPEETPKQ